MRSKQTWTAVGCPLDRPVRATRTADELTLMAKAHTTAETARTDTEPTPAARAKPAPEPTRRIGAAAGSASDDHRRSRALAAARSMNEPKLRVEPTATGSAASRKPLSARRTNRRKAWATDPRAVPPEVTELERSNVCMTRRKQALTFDMSGRPQAAKLAVAVRSMEGLGLVLNAEPPFSGGKDEATRCCVCLVAK